MRTTTCPCVFFSLHPFVWPSARSRCPSDLVFPAGRFRGSLRPVSGPWRRRAASFPSSRGGLCFVLPALMLLDQASWQGGDGNGEAAAKRARGCRRRRGRGRSVALKFVDLVGSGFCIFCLRFFFRFFFSFSFLSLFLFLFLFFFFFSCLFSFSFPSFFV